MEVPNGVDHLCWGTFTTAFFCNQGEILNCFGYLLPTILCLFQAEIMAQIVEPVLDICRRNFLYKQQMLKTDILHGQELTVITEALENKDGKQQCHQAQFELNVEQ